MRPIRKLVLCLLLAIPCVVHAQYANEPYFDAAELIRYGHVTNLVEARVAALDAVAATGELPEEMAEQARRMLEEDLPRIAGSLEEAAPQLLRDLEAALVELAELSEAGDTEALRPVAQRVADLAVEARQRLIGPEGAERNGVKAAVISRLLLGEPGVAEGYEEAVAGERWEYTLGWGALQQVKEAWAELEPEVAGRSDEVDEALFELDELYPGPIPPEDLSGDPEAGEEPAHRITSLLEGITDSNLYPERELGRVAAKGAGQASSACSAFEEGNDGLAMELTLAVQDAYESISGTVGMLAAEAHERVESALDGITGGGEEEDEEAGEGRDEVDEEERPVEEAEEPTGDPLELCRQLQQGLEEITQLFGG
ncbi:MAG TPA: hypothetical protein VF168_09235 [Trueperaceae bacterium]